MLSGFSNEEVIFDANVPVCERGEKSKSTVTIATATEGADGTPAVAVVVGVEERKSAEALQSPAGPSRSPTYSPVRDESVANESSSDYSSPPLPVNAAAVLQLPRRQRRAESVLQGQVFLTLLPPVLRQVPPGREA